MNSGKHLAIGIGGVCALIGAVVLLFIVPNYREAKQVRMRVADLQVRVDLLSKRTEVVDRLEAEVRAAREQAAMNLKTIPSTADVAGLIRKLSDQIDDVNVVEQTFTAGTPGPAIIAAEESVSVRSLPVATDMKATFESALALVRKAEAMPRLIRVASVRLQCKREEQKADIPLLRAAIGLEAIYDEGVVARKGS